jgi:spermidine/putrescine-binding protein
MSNSTTPPDGLRRVRQYVNLDRRQLLKMAGAAGVVAAVGLPGIRGRAMAASSLNYVGWEGYDTFLAEGGAEESIGMPLQKTYISASDEVVTKLRLSAGQVDICTPYFIHDKFLAEEGLIEPLDVSKIPNFSKINPTIMEYCKSNMQFEGKWYAAPMTYGSICMLYNADKAKKPTSWTDMLKDEYKNKCAITADYTGNLFAWARVTGVENPHRMTRKQLAKVVETMIDLKKNHLRTIAPSYGDLTEMLSSGEVVISQGWEPVTTWVGDGANIKIAYPKEKSMGFIEGYAIGKGSANTDEAYAYIDNALSLQGQLAGATANSMPVVTEEAMAKADPANKDLYNYDHLKEYFEDKTMVVPMYPLEQQGDLAVWDDYQEAWEKILKS